MVTSGGSFNRGDGGMSRESKNRGAAGSTGVSRGLGVQDQAWGAPAPVMSGEAVQLLSLIKNTQNPMGASRFYKLFANSSVGKLKKCERRRKLICFWVGGVLPLP